MISRQAGIIFKRFAPTGYCMPPINTNLHLRLKKNTLYKQLLQTH
jgi:hypothetical protein